MNYAERKVRNDAMKAHAEKDRQPWTGTEVELLLEWDGTETELIDLAELFGRTIEACRQHYYLSRRDPQAALRHARGHASHGGSSGEGARTSPLRGTLSMAAWSDEDREEWSWLGGGQ